MLTDDAPCLNAFLRDGSKNLGVEFLKKNESISLSHFSSDDYPVYD